MKIGREIKREEEKRIGERKRNGDKEEEKAVFLKKTELLLSFHTNRICIACYHGTLLFVHAYIYIYILFNFNIYTYNSIRMHINYINYVKKLFEKLMYLTNTLSKIIFSVQ